MPTIKTHAIRLKPGEDLKQAIQSYANEHKLHAAWIVTCVGSLTHYNIRFANQEKGSHDSGHFEILSLAGTISDNGSHMHICLGDSTGKATGGHLQDGCIVYTTAEIIIQSSDGLVFSRKKDGSTPWAELQVEEL